MQQPAWTGLANGENKRLVLHVQLRCGSLSITTPGILLANEFNVHGQVSFAAVNQICVIHEAMNGWKNVRFIKGLVWECKYKQMKPFSSSEQQAMSSVLVINFKLPTIVGILRFMTRTNFTFHAHCMCWCFTSLSTFFLSCWDVVLGDKVSCSRTQHSASGNPQTSKTSIFSLTLYHWANLPLQGS